jgi:hypothetical protein
MRKDHVFDFIKHDAVASKSSLLADIQNFAVCSTEDRDNRLQICNNCEQLKHNFCAKCSCYMPLKAYLKQAACPLKLF